PQPAPSASCSGPAAPANQPGTPGTRAAAPNGRTSHQTAPHTPPTAPAPPGKADVSSSHAPGNSAPPSRVYRHSVVNKLPLTIFNDGGYGLVTAGLSCGMPDA